jgi:type I restriction enzyme M protein
MERFDFDTQIEKLDQKDRLYAVVGRFADSKIDLSPTTVSNEDMGRLNEELLRRFSEQSNETAGEHFTPREVIRLMVNLRFIEEKQILTQKGIVKTLYDPACGTGGMLSVAEEYVQELNPGARLELFGQEVNDESYAVCKSDMLIKGFNPNNIRLGDSFTNDHSPATRTTICSPIRPLVWSGSRHRISSRPNTTTRDSTAGSAPACLGSATERCFSSST